MSGLTYRALGASLREDLMEHPPTGYRPLARVVRIGEGDDAWERAVAETLTLGIQRRSGLVPVRTTTGRVTLGERAVLRLGPLRIPIEVVAVIDEPARRGFAYGTLRGHPESGEEDFLVERGDDGSVWLRIRAFSRPAHPLLWIGYPVLRLFQEAYTRRYERALTRR